MSWTTSDTQDWFGAGAAYPLLMPEFTSGCVVQTVKYSVALTSSTDLSTLASAMNIWVLRVDAASTTLEAQLLKKDALIGTNVPSTLSGTSLGGSCGSLVFQRGLASFLGASSPYTGNYAPFVDGIVGDASDFLAGQPYMLYINAGTAPGPQYTLVCWTMEITMN